MIFIMEVCIVMLSKQKKCKNKSIMGLKSSQLYQVVEQRKMTEKNSELSLEEMIKILE